ncbi:MAG: hypothetical protein ABIK73_09070 [candidate division WOR-3 bacterium]
MADFYQTLVQELQNDPLGFGYASMTNAQVAEILNAKTRKKIVQRFVSLRAIATVLTDEEYAAFKQVLSVAATQSPRVADMVAFLEMPCDDSGTTGGIDFGNEQVRGFITQLCSAIENGEQIKNKLLGLAEVPCSRLEELGITEVVNEHHIESARKMMGG